METSRRRPSIASLAVALLLVVACSPHSDVGATPAAWIILVGRNSVIDTIRRRAKDTELDEQLPDAELDVAERLDDAHYRDDILGLLFICCHPDLPVTRQLALALRRGIPRRTGKPTHYFSSDELLPSSRRAMISN